MGLEKKRVGTVLPEREIVDSLPLNARSSRLGNATSFPCHPSLSSLHQGRNLGEKCRLSAMMRHVEGSAVDGRVKAKEREGSDTVEGGVSEVVPSSSSAVGTGHSRPLALAGLLSRREDTVTACWRLFVRGRRDKEAMPPAVMLLP
jgi:hypothetical protein